MKFILIFTFFLYFLTCVIKANTEDGNLNRWIAISSECLRPFGYKKPILCYQNETFIPGREYQLFITTLLSTTPTTNATAKTTTTTLKRDSSTVASIPTTTQALTTTSSFFIISLPHPSSTTISNAKLHNSTRLSVFRTPFFNYFILSVIHLSLLCSSWWIYVFAFVLFSWLLSHIPYKGRNSL